MSSIINKVKEVGGIVKDVITGRTNIHHSKGVVGHNIRPHNFPKDPNPDPPPKRHDFNDLPPIGGRPQIGGRPKDPNPDKPFKPNPFSGGLDFRPLGGTRQDVRGKQIL